MRTYISKWKKYAQNTQLVKILYILPPESSKVLSSVIKVWTVIFTTELRHTCGLLWGTNLKYGSKLANFDVFCEFLMLLTPWKCNSTYFLHILYFQHITSTRKCYSLHILYCQRITSTRKTKLWLFKGTLLQIWKSVNIFVFIWK